MKLIISENRLYNLFSKYIDSTYNLKYDREVKRFYDEDNDDEFGFISFNVFWFWDEDIKNRVESIFGENTDQFMYEYLRTKFPNVYIESVEDSYPPQEDQSDSTQEENF